MKTQLKSHKQKPNWLQKLQYTAKHLAAGKEALHNAVKNGNLKEVESLNKYYDYDINNIDVYGYSPLHQSIKYEQYHIMLWLLQHSEVNVNRYSNPNKRYQHLEFKKPEKIIQPYLRTFPGGHPTANEFTRQYNRSLVRILVMHGLTEEGVTFNQHYPEFKKLFLAMRELYKKKQEAEAKFLSDSPKEAYETCQYLEGVWRGLAQQEESTIAKFNHEKYLNLKLFKLLNTFYQEKADSYVKQAKIYEAKLDDNIISTKSVSAPVVKESVAVNYSHPANLTVLKRRDNVAESNNNITIEEIPLLADEEEEFKSFSLTKKFN